MDSAERSSTGDRPGREDGRVVPLRRLSNDSATWRVRAAGGELPQRYEVRGGSDDERYLRCREAPGLAVRIDRSYAFSETEAQRLGERVILLDGAGSFAPTVSAERHLYNLDHHTGCVRAFTLATCEQALVLVLKGLDLGRGNWQIYANDPDLDTVFAVWVLLNHRRLGELPPRSRDAVAPLLRLEGAIDANGFEVAEMCGLPMELVEAGRAELDRLRRRELELKAAGEWVASDPLDYTAEVLAEIDRLVYDWTDFTGFTDVDEEYDHVDIGGDRVALVCRDEAGIYEVETRLKKLWGERLGIVALEKEPGQFTLRRTAALAGIDLDRAYERLNYYDPAVDGRPAEKRWGGSDDIGGSPRPGGTALSPQRIAAVLARTYRPAGLAEKLRRVALSVAAAAGLIATVVAGGWLWRTLAGTLRPAAGQHAELAAGGLLAAVLALPITLWASGRQPGLFGWRRPAAGLWLLLALPAAALAAVAPPLLPDATPAGAGGALAVGVTALAALAAAAAHELWLRGIAHGLAAELWPVHGPGSGRKLPSQPTLLAALLHAVIAFAAWRWGLITLPAELDPTSAAALAACCGLLTGALLGVLRERCLSLWPGAAALAAGWLARALLG